MGWNASSDELCQRTDEAIQGIPWNSKIVDDIIVYAPDTLLQRIQIVLQRYHDHNITISKKKLQVGDSVKSSGFLVTSSRVKPDPEKVRAISDFPVPTDVSALRSFLGLANQIRVSIPDLAHMCEPLRQLLKKNVALNWLPDHQTFFVKLKQALTSSMVVKYFDPLMRTELLTDASRWKGLGFALIQRDDKDQIRLIQCRSCSLILAETAYATVEVECLAIKWAINKSHHFLMGMFNFRVITDHRPLVGVFQKPLQDIENTLVQKYREKLGDYSFKVSWTAGKTHLVADALSRVPAISPGEMDAKLAHVFNKIAEDPKLVQEANDGTGRNWTKEGTGLRKELDKGRNWTKEGTGQRKGLDEGVWYILKYFAQHRM